MCFLLLITGCSKKTNYAKDWEEPFEEIIKETEQIYFPVIEGDAKYNEITFSSSLNDKHFSYAVDYSLDKNEEKNYSFSVTTDLFDPEIILESYNLDAPLDVERNDFVGVAGSVEGIDMLQMAVIKNNTLYEWIVHDDTITDTNQLVENEIDRLKNDQNESEILQEIQTELVDKMLYFPIDAVESARFSFRKNFRVNEYMFDLQVPLAENSKAITQLKVRSKEQADREIYFDTEPTTLKTKKKVEVNKYVDPNTEAQIYTFENEELVYIFQIIDIDDSVDADTAEDHVSTLIDQMNQ